MFHNTGITVSPITDSSHMSKHKKMSPFVSDILLRIKKDMHLLCC